jgi:hypothetical protein
MLHSRRAHEGCVIADETAGADRSALLSKLPYALLTVALAAALMAPVMTRGWFHHDEGMLGQTAERVMMGEVPHRDFDEPYTGLITYWHALAFKIGGVQLATLRWWFFVPILAWTLAVHRVAARFVPPWVAVPVTIACLLWGVSNWAVPMASWFNLFLGTAGALALLRWREDQRARWLVLAGVAGGLSFLAKLSGVFFLFGAGLALIYLSSASEREGEARSRGGAVLVAGILTLALVVLFVPFARSGVRELVRYWIPLLIIGGALVSRELRHGVTLRERLRELWNVVVPLKAGIALVLVPWVVVLLAQGAFDATMLGVFVTPFRRLAGASRQPPPFSVFIGSAVAILYLWPRRTARLERLVGALGALVAVLLFVWSRENWFSYRLGWFLGWGIPFTTAAITCVLIAKPRADGDAQQAAWREGGIILGLVGAAMLLVEYPFAAPIYTMMALAVPMLAAVALYRATMPRVQMSAWVVLAFFVAFGMFRLRPGSVLNAGVIFGPSPDTALMDVPRSGLRVTPQDSSAIHQIVARLDQFPAEMKIWAGPEAPEIYFLSGRPNSTRVIFEMLATDSLASKTVAERAIASGADVVVIKTYTQFAARATPADLSALHAHYGRAERVSRYFVFYR